MLIRAKFISLLFLIFLSSVACELTEEELSNLDRIIGEDQNPGTDFDRTPLAPNCHEQAYRQPQAEISKKIDLLFVVDTSGSLNSERQQIGDGVDAFLEALPADVDANVGVTLAHVGSRAGKLYRKDSAQPLVLKSSEMSSADIRSQLAYRMRYTVSESVSDGGEALLYSFNKMLDEEYAAIAKTEGLFRDEAALVVVFVTDENDICARYPEGVTPVFDGNLKEIPAFNNYCGDVTPESVLQKLRIRMQDKPALVSGIIYHEGSNVPNGGENEMAYGIMEIIEQANGAMIDLSGGNFHTGLEQIGNLAVKKLNLRTEFQLASSNIDPDTINVKVDNSPVEYAFNALNSTILLTDYAGIENSEVYINYCEPPEEPDDVAPVITNLLVKNITGASATVTWTTDLDASSQVEITHVASGSKVLTSLGASLKKDHAIGLSGLSPDTLYSVKAISVSNGVETTSEAVDFRTGRSLN